VRLSPSGTFNGVSCSNPQAQFSDLVTKCDQRGLAYIHVVDPRTVARRRKITPCLLQVKRPMCLSVVVTHRSKWWTPWLVKGGRHEIETTQEEVMKWADYFSDCFVCPVFVSFSVLSTTNNSLIFGYLKTHAFVCFLWSFWISQWRSLEKELSPPATPFPCL
jgi:hypothetical protein